MSSNIHLYTTQTPNGIKVSITLEELGLKYEHTKIDISKNTQKEPWFLEINPNGRIPAVTDTFTDGKPIRLFESGSIMQYLVDRYDTEYKISYPKGTREYIEMTNWLFFQNASQGPMQGQANHFFRYAPEKIEYGINRYQNETRRLYGVLDKHLSDTGSKFLVGDKLTIADIAHWGWISAGPWAGIDTSEFPTLEAWEKRVYEREAVQKGADVPEKYKLKELLNDPAAVEKKANAARDWIQASMKAEAERK
ncbi:unnamed protein product [Zymoseptoria tritici ST99CH_1A5]|uniref:Glutathione S-transferase n=4 Tax=Zymoseptoria tritici TaxID=1047171 RepID=F9WWN5_ZYMTI|nr:uncharacterized protein MYCGRDRAFT_102530 [Zymoseptoria tritici IPO323]SMQ46047.1 unnamed protein product [Zymoseptoria tritici ST99CH_3D7]SMR42393.1 unnamed protein product [Zymoseptoria tritici ST99CH_1E4]SMR44570.1 unnamed protein product [Zymoseptoria tritici ST99CH_3D1]SMY19732.1 unnamed protein product [Zymoseptoria tritici ST99CH_1A5]EGP92274.1 hypothetical protein MYCGRDRAFT_102530 [Zymoseptoria tritici IPO323]